MKREELTELHYIAPISNLASILANGILSHNKAKRLAHDSVALEDMQKKRVVKVVPQGLRLHDYVNLYIHSRNPMLFKIRNEHEALCVLKVSCDVLDLPAVVISDQNAASDYVHFSPSPGGLKHLNVDWVFAESWNDADQIQKWRKASARAAEVLVPQAISSSFIKGAYVSNDGTKLRIEKENLRIDCETDPHLFFR